VFADSEPDTTSADEPVADELNVPLRLAFPGKNADAEPEVLKVELREPLLGIKALAVPFALNEPDSEPVAGR